MVGNSRLIEDRKQDQHVYECLRCGVRRCMLGTNVKAVMARFWIVDDIYLYRILNIMV